MVIALLASAGPALAQEVDPLSEPNQPRWYGVVIAIVLVLGTIVASFISSKRGHQD